jgi:N-methylhydantoinase A/oxoprolinase/acetone carboxylase beta subunit
MVCMKYVLSVDVGGTFTDLAAFGTDGIALHKRPTDSEHPAIGVLEGLTELLNRLSAAPRDVARVVHATTLPTNALIGRQGARTALLTTAGFRDVLEIGTEQIHSIFDLFQRRPEPLIPRHLRREAHERVSAAGDVLTALDEDATAALLDELAAERIESLAVCFLHAYRQPRHEQRVLEIAASRQPQLAVSLSSEVASVIGEYERTATVCVDAYLKPMIGQYLSELEHGIRDLGIDGELQLVSSAGGVLDVATAAGNPVRLLESGAAAGALAAAWFGTRAGQSEVLALDFGGTTAKVCLIERGRPLVARSFEADRTERLVAGSGITVHAPCVDLIEIGAGGGSIARVDALGLLKVGPESAGSTPGPACYGRGGQLPTVTDADLVLELLDAERFLGGRMPLDRVAARRAIDLHVAQPLEVSISEAAWGIHAVAEQAMTRAARAHLRERNRDPRDVSMVAFGGAGPVHAAGIAQALGIAKVIVPFGAGVASALGCLTLDRSVVFVHTYMTRLTECDWRIVQALYDRLARLGDHGRGNTRHSAGVDVRFEGQFHELHIELDWPPGSHWLPQVERRFRRRYRAIYGRLPRDLPIEAVHWYLTCETSQAKLERLPPPPSVPSVDPIGDRAVDGAVQAWAVYERADVGVGTVILGPGIIVEEETSVVVPVGWRVCSDEQRNLVLDWEAA